jgi:hypothetical protein
MSRSDDGVYDAAIVCAFVEAHLEDERPPLFPYPGARKTSHQKLLNGIRVNSSHRGMLARWALRETVSLAKVDSFLHQYGLMTWELEDWSDRTFGRSGFLEPAGAGST